MPFRRVIGVDMGGSKLLWRGMAASASTSCANAPCSVSTADTAHTVQTAVEDVIQYTGGDVTPSVFGIRR